VRGSIEGPAGLLQAIGCVTAKIGPHLDALEAGYRDHRDCYRAMATSLGFEEHLSWAEAMP
jgi:hypothetical protein